MTKNSFFESFRNLLGVKSPKAKQKKKKTEAAQVPPESQASQVPPESQASQVPPESQASQVPSESQATPAPVHAIQAHPPIQTPAEEVEFIKKENVVHQKKSSQTKAEKVFFQILERARTGAPIFEEDLQTFSEILKSSVHFDEIGGPRNASPIEYLCDTYFPNPALLKVLLENQWDPKIKWGNNAPMIVLINRGFEAYSKGHIDDKDEDFAESAVLLASFGAIREKEDWEEVRSLLPKLSEDGLIKPEDAYILKMRNAIRKGAEIYQNLKKREAVTREPELKLEEKSKRKRFPIE